MGRGRALRVGAGAAMGGILLAVVLADVARSDDALSVRETLRNVDVAPTVAALLGIQMPGDIQGQTIAAILADKR